MRGALDQVRLSIVIANYNGMGTLPGMLASLKAYPNPLEEIIVVDDGSSDGSVDWLRATHPDIRLVAFEANTGNLAKVRNAGLQAARGTHAFLTDNDIEFLPDCLHRLLEVVVADDRLFCVTPRLVYYARPDVIFQDGNGMHFLALGTGNLRGIKVADAGVPAPFPTCGGGMMLFDLARARQVGGFDPGYMHAWADDGEYQLRGALYGFRCLHVPAAAAMHHAKDHGAGRALGQIHNRFRVLLTFYRARTLLVMLPSLLLFELALIAGSVAHGSAAPMSRLCGAPGTSGVRFGPCAARCRRAARFRTRKSCAAAHSSSRVPCGPVAPCAPRPTSCRSYSTRTGWLRVGCSERALRRACGEWRHLVATARIPLLRHPTRPGTTS